MSPYQAFRRVPVDPQAAQKLETMSFPAPTRGLIMDENFAYMQPGGAVVLDNWKPTMRGIALRGGCKRWCVLPETNTVVSAFPFVGTGTSRYMFAATATTLYDVTTPTAVVVQSGQHSGNYCASQMSNQGGDWMIVVNDYGDYPLRFNGSTWTQLNGTPPSAWVNGTAYTVGNRVLDTTDGSWWKCTVAHTSAPITPPNWANSTFYTVGMLAHDATDNTYWQCFIAHNSAASSTTFLQDRTNHPNYWGGYPPTNTTFAQDRFVHPSYWSLDQAADNVSYITGPPGSKVANGNNLVFVCKYRGRYFFIEADSFNAWYLPTNSVGGALALVPLSGHATKGGKLLFCAVWSLDAGDGLDDNIVFGTTEGELIVFNGSDPSNINSWKQVGRFQAAPPLGMNAHLQVGADLLLMTTDGIVPMSACISKSFEDLELAAITHQIRQMWRDEVNLKRTYPWTLVNWEQYGGLFVAIPGGAPGARYCLYNNTSTTAWARYVGWDATCFIRMFDNLYFGTQTGIIMQADQTGYDDGVPYTAIMVGGWEVFQSPGQTLVWRQSRCNFAAPAAQPFNPQLSACTDYIVNLPPPPPAGPDPGTLDVWDQGLWGGDQTWPPTPPSPADILQYAQWDQAAATSPVVRNTMWISIGRTGFSHAPVVQVTVAQLAPPNVELITTSAVFERAGINV